MSDFEFPPYESFFHGPITSKLWLCREIERALRKKNIDNATVNVLGSWTNILAFMLIVRNAHMYHKFNGYDIDINAITAADAICDTWKRESPKVDNYLADINQLDFSSCNKSTIFINCSVDHLDSTKWYDTIPKGRLICIQATDVNIPDAPWFIRQHTSHISALLYRYPMTEIIYKGSKRIQYDSWGFTRFMVIGMK